MVKLSPQIARFKESHHQIARMFAAGMTPMMITRHTGYSSRRLNLYWRDPTFQELIAEYAKLEIEELQIGGDAYARLAMNNMIAAERQLADKIEDADELGETLPTRELLAISADRADRFGYSKRNTQVNINLDIASQIDRAIDRSGIKVIEAAASPSTEVNFAPGPKLLEGRSTAIQPTSRHSAPRIQRRILPTNGKLARRV